MHGNASLEIVIVHNLFIYYFVYYNSGPVALLIVCIFVVTYTWRLTHGSVNIYSLDGDYNDFPSTAMENYVENCSQNSWFTNGIYYYYLFIGIDSVIVVVAIITTST